MRAPWKPDDITATHEGGGTIAFDSCTAAFLVSLSGRADLERELRQTTGDHKKLVDAIIAGVPAEQVKDRMITLDAPRKELETLLSAAPAPDPVRFHPSMAGTYRTRVGALIRGLSDTEEAKEALRALVEKVVLVPVEAEDGGTRLAIDLHGALAGLLRMPREATGWNWLGNSPRSCRCQRAPARFPVAVALI